MRFNGNILAYRRKYQQMTLGEAINGFSKSVVTNTFSLVEDFVLGFSGQKCILNTSLVPSLIAILLWVAPAFLLFNAARRNEALELNAFVERDIASERRYKLRSYFLYSASLLYFVIALLFGASRC
jgi:hypothetical protein